MFNQHRYIIILFILLAGMIACNKWDDYKKYLDKGEKVYPESPSKLQASPGNGRVLLSWVRGLEAGISKYIILWNNGNDSVIVEAAGYKYGDTVKRIISGLPESNYTFTLFSMDEQGNRSVPALLPPTNVYGPKYQASLLNRPVTTVDYSGTTNILTIGWGTPDTINLQTRIWYTDLSGTEKTVLLAPSEASIEIPWLVGSKIYYQSTYKPTSGAIDQFEVLNKDSVTVKFVPVPKASWTIAALPNDIAGDAYGTSLTWLWDGKGGGYPEIYHNGSSSGMPHHFTIDLGAEYIINKLEETGRTDCDCHNVTEFEVWGIADTTGAATSLPGNDAGWAQESVSKGWTLLKTVVRSDDGIAPFSASIDDNTLPFRFIRIRVLKTRDNSPESHMSELTFWYAP